MELINGCLEYQFFRFKMPFKVGIIHFRSGIESVHAYKCKQGPQTLTKELCNYYSKEASLEYFFRFFIYL